MLLLRQILRSMNLLKENTKHILILIGALTISVILICLINIHYKRELSKPRFTPGQRAVVDAMTKARIQLEQAQNNLDAKEKELKQLIDAENKASLINNLGKDVIVQWIPISDTRNSFVAITCNGKPVCFGFRNDGFVTWKSQ